MDFFLGLLVFSLAAAITFFMFKKRAARQNTHELSKTIIDLYTKARVQGMEPHAACLEAVAELYPRAENVKTKVHAIGVLNRRSQSGSLPRSDQALVAELVKTIVVIQSKLELEMNDEKRQMIIDECCKKLEEKFSSTSLPKTS